MQHPVRQGRSKFRESVTGEHWETDIVVHREGTLPKKSLWMGGGKDKPHV